MSFNKRFFPVGGIVASSEAACTTDTADKFGDTNGIALYTLDYDASDASGNYDGTPTDVEFGVGGQINYGARFNGSSSKITLPSGFLDSAQTLSFSVWVNPTNILSFSGILDKYIGSTSGWALHIPSSTNKFAEVLVYNGSDINTTATTALPLGDWTHIVGTISTSQVKIYINGTLEDTSALSSPLTTNTTPLIVGGDAVSTLSFDGSIDQLRFFTKELNSTEVSTLYAETACVYTCTTDTVDYPTTNVAYYKLDNSAIDETGSFDGTETDISYTFGRFGQAAVFNGSSSKIINSSFSQPSGDLSVSLWVKFNTISSTQKEFFDWSGGGTQGLLRINSYNSNDLRFSYGSGERYISFDGYTINTDTWYHLVFVKDGSTAKSYFDNNALTTFSISGTQTGTGLFLGCNQDQTRFSDCTIDQVRIFSSALDSTQVTQLYEEKPCADTSTFKTVLYSGAASEQYISNVGFNLDVNDGGEGGLLWIKGRTNSLTNHRLFDTVRGASAGSLASNLTNAEMTASGGVITSFDANGFTIPNQQGDVNGYPRDYVAWVWKAGGDAVSNTNGSITSQVSANQDAGFSIVKYTGNGTVGATIGHGLSSAPEFSIIKKLDTVGYSGGNWVIGYGSYNTDLYLNSSATAGTNNYFWNAAPTSTVLEVKNDWFVNYSGAGYISYNFHSVSGVSKVGSYVGDGTDNFSKQITGLGFDPSFVMVKNVDSSGSNWEIIDVRRGDGQNLYANENYSENANSPTSYGTGNLITDGFAVRRGTVSTSVHWNKSGNTFIYLAFA